MLSNTAAGWLVIGLVGARRDVIDAEVEDLSLDDRGVVIKLMLGMLHSAVLMECEHRGGTLELWRQGAARAIEMME